VYFFFSFSWIPQCAILCSIMSSCRQFWDTIWLGKMTKKLVKWPECQKFSRLLILEATWFVKGRGKGIHYFGNFILVGPRNRIQQVCLLVDYIKLVTCTWFVVAWSSKSGRSNQSSCKQTQVYYLVRCCII